MVLSNPCAEITVSKENLFNHVKALTSTPRPRNFYNVASLDSAAAYIKTQLEQYGYSPKEQVFQVEGNDYRNIHVLIGPENTKRVVIGAHYDVCGEQAGADDNASAVAGLLELARIAKLHEKNLKNQLEFVAYTLEEPPHFRTMNMGSYVHAQSLFDSSIDVKVMICLEMIGFFSDERIQRYPLSILKLFYPKKADFIAVVGNFSSNRYIKKVKRSIRKNSSIHCRSLAAPAFVTGVDFSDHRNYWGFGYKAVMITNTSFYRNRNYHTTKDTIDTLDFDRMTEVVKGVAGYLFWK
jgi:hypothetical protein